MKFVPPSSDGATKVMAKVRDSSTTPCNTAHLRSAMVRMHVAAKRYLASMEPGYFDTLSEASKLSLRLQGGPMSPAALG